MSIITPTDTGARIRVLDALRQPDVLLREAPQLIIRMVGSPLLATIAAGTFGPVDFADRSFRAANWTGRLFQHLEEVELSYEINALSSHAVPCWEADVMLSALILDPPSRARAIQAWCTLFTPTTEGH